MRCRHSMLRLVIVGLSLSLAANAWSANSSRAACEKEFAPRSGQAGKDVIWVPTQEDLVMAMLKAAKVTEKDYVVDLGSGDGRIPIAAAKHFGARATGIEYNPDMVRLAQCYVRAEGLEGKVEIKEADIFKTDFRDATVVTMYLLSDLNMRLRPTILKMKPGTRVVSNSFRMGDWEPDADVEPENSYSRGYLWIVPAQVSGEWTLRPEGSGEDLRLKIEQEFQKIDASLLGQPGYTLQSARLSGANIELTLVGTDKQTTTLKGTVEDDSMKLSGRLGGKTVTYTGRRS